MRKVLRRVEKLGACDVRRVLSRGSSGHITPYPTFDIYMYKSPDSTVEEMELDLGTLQTSVAKDPQGNEIRFRGLQHNCVHIDVSGYYVIRPKPLNLVDHEVATNRYAFVVSARRYVEGRDDVVTSFPDEYRGKQYRYCYSVGFSDDTDSVVVVQSRTQILENGVWKTSFTSTSRVKWTSASHGIYPASVDPIYQDSDEDLFPSKIPIQRLSEFDRKCDEALTMGQLALVAAERKRILDINTILYVKDILEIPKLARSIASPEVFRNLRKRDSKRVLSQIAKLYLANHYGLRLTVADTQEIASALDKLDLSREYEYVSAEEDFSFSDGWATGDVKVTRKITGIVNGWSNGQLEVVDSVRDAMSQFSKKVLRYGYEFDVVPSLANIWDSLPFSFVCDWFSNIGDYFSAIESKHHLETFLPRVVYQSTTYDWSQSYGHSDERREVLASLHIHAYKRNVDTTFPQYTPRLNSPPAAKCITHAIEGGALLCSFLS